MLLAHRIAVTVALALSAVSLLPAQIRLGPESIPALSGVENGSGFGYSVARLGDLDGNGVDDLAVGAPRDSQAWFNSGAVWILFMNEDGTVLKTHKISPATDNLVLRPNDQFFGSRIGALGDFRGAGYYEISAAGPNRGYLLRLDEEGHVVSQFPLPIDDSPEATAANLGDLNGDGPSDLAITRHHSRTGAVDMFLVRPDGEIRTSVRIGEGQGGWPDVLDLNDKFAWDIANIGDLNGDGRNELVVGAPGDDDLFQETGAVYVFFLLGGGLVQAYQKISATEGGFRGELNGGDRFGKVVESLGDLDGDGINELAVGAPGDGAGSIWVLFLNEDGTVKNETVFQLVDYGIPVHDVIAGNLESGLALTPDFNGDGVPDVAVGLPTEGNSGSVWLLPALADLGSGARFFDIDPNVARTGADVPVEIQAVGVGGVSSVEISFRRGGDLTFFSAPMVSDGDFHRFSIPAFVASSRGLEYEVTLVNVAGRATRLPRDGFVSVQLATPDGLTIPVPSGDAASGYRIVSIPLEYEPVSLLGMLESSLGLSNRANWRAFTITRGSTVELTNQSAKLSPGTAFWMLSRETGRVLQPGAGRTVRTDRAFKVPLQREWNLVGNPFDFPVLLNQLSTVHGNELDIRTYEGDWEIQTDALEPRRGYAVFSEQIDTLIIDPRLRESVSKRSMGVTSSRLAWSIDVQATAGNATDRHNVLGTSIDAADGWDHYDLAEPPVIGDYVSTYFRDESSGPTSRLQADIRGPETGAHVWNLEVVAARQRAVTLQFGGLESLPDELNAWLSDPVTGEAWNLRHTPNLRVVAGSAQEPRHLTVQVGKNLSPIGQPETPIAFDLFEAFPNPFVYATTVRFALATTEKTTVSVYDVAGRLVSVIAEERELEAGVHSMVWDGIDEQGRSVASGLYFVRVDAGDKSGSIAVSAAR